MRRNASGATVAGITSELKIGISNAFEVQLGYTFQRSRYDEPERWSDDAEPQRRMFRTPDHYGYMTASADIARNLRASLFGNYTGRMLVQHNAGWIERDTDRLTPAFWDMGLRFSYLFRLTNVISMQLDAGVKNIFDSYQSDLDRRTDKSLGIHIRALAASNIFRGTEIHHVDIKLSSAAATVAEDMFTLRPTTARAVRIPYYI